MVDDAPMPARYVSVHTPAESRHKLVASKLEELLPVATLDELRTQAKSEDPCFRPRARRTASDKASLAVIEH